ncbi:hypothetical protein OG871_08390 [Kitasatospora sp. NBC_00374]|uniref:hypothetical protein n=1 Tax=Kitasatospora sp. NBC_00374 TaxID=2975964 RepID=UPI0030E25797
MTGRTHEHGRTGLWATALCAVLLTACSGTDPQPVPATPTTGASSTPSPTPSPRPTSVELTDTYFAQGQCAAPVSDRDARVGGVTTYRVASCTDALAVATVTRRSPTVVVTVESATTEPGCEDTTDLTIDLAANLVRATGAQGTDGAMTAYACLRTLREPHPGDPGNGGGFKIIKGDCVYAATGDPGGRTVAETRCDGTGAHRPEYRIRELVELIAPRSTAGGGSCSDTGGTVLTLPRYSRYGKGLPKLACGVPL